MLAAGAVATGFYVVRNSRQEACCRRAALFTPNDALLATIVNATGTVLRVGSEVRVGSAVSGIVEKYTAYSREGEVIAEIDDAGNAEPASLMPRPRMPWMRRASSAPV